MEISRDVFFKIFKNNFIYDVVDTPLGMAVKMPPVDAFIYASVTGAGYLENPIYPFTPKGLLKLFYNAFDYKFVTGIFDNSSLKNTPYLMSLARPYLFSEAKYVVPMEFHRDKELIDNLTNRFSSITDPHNYVIQRIELRKGGNGMEPFMEYLAGEHFKSHGYIVENQIPLAHSIGSPDFGAYRLFKVFQSLSSFGFLPGSGFHIVELAMIRLNRYIGDKAQSSNNHLIVGEAKTNTDIMTNQLNKYLKTGLFDEGYEIHPSKVKPAEKYFGLIYIDTDYKLRIIQPEAQFINNSKLSKNSYLEWLTNYMKFYLLANFTNDELDDLYHATTGSSISSQADIVDFGTKLGIDFLLNAIKDL